MRKKLTVAIAALTVCLAVFAFSACSLPEAPAKYVGVEITSMPDKTEYIEGDTFDPSGMVVSAVYSDGNKETISADKYNYDLKRPLEVTDTYVVVLYMDKMIDVKIKVIPDSAESVTIKTPASRVDYYAGEVFDPTGLVVTADCISGKTKDVTYSATDEKFAFDDTPLTLGQEQVEVIYDGIAVSQTITVTPAPVPYSEFGAYLADCASDEKTPVFVHEAVVPFNSDIYLFGGNRHSEVKGTTTDGEYIYAAIAYGEKKATARIFKLDPETGESLGCSAEYTASSEFDIVLYVKDGEVYTRMKNGDDVVTGKIAAESLTSDGENVISTADAPVFVDGAGAPVTIRDIDYNAEKQKYAVLVGETVCIYSADGVYESSITVPSSGKSGSDDLWNSHISTTEGYIYISYHNLYLDKHVHPVIKVYDWSGNAVMELTVAQDVIKSGEYTKQTDVLIMGDSCYAFYENPLNTVLQVGISRTYTTEKQEG